MFAYSGKEVLVIAANGKAEHYADAVDPTAAQAIAEALNRSGGVTVTEKSHPVPMSENTLPGNSVSRKKGLPAQWRDKPGVVGKRYWGRTPQIVEAGKGPRPDQILPWETVAEAKARIAAEASA